MKNVFIIAILFVSISVFAQKQKFGKVSKAALEEKFYPLDSTAEAAYLYKYRRTYFDYSSGLGFRVITDVHDRIKIYNKKGFKYANKKLYYYSSKSGNSEKLTSIKGFTFNLENGKIRKEKLSKKSIFKEKLNKYTTTKKMAFPSIKEGSIIEYKYQLVSPFFSIRNLDFQFAIPVKKIIAKIETPQYFEYAKKSKGYYFIPIKRSTKNEKITFRNGGTLDFITNVVAFDTENIPALKDDEPFVSNIKNYRGALLFELRAVKMPNTIVENYSTTWKDVSKQIYKYSSFGGELRKTNYFKKDLEAILSTAKNDDEKITIIFDFVKSKVKWNGYYSKFTDKGVKKAYKEGVGNSGDINLMLTAMLRFAGLNANPVLVSTRNHGVPIFPTIKGFNLVISMVEFDDGSYVLLDATEPYSLPNLLPKRNLNWKGRKVTKKGNSNWVTLFSNSKPASEDNRLNIKITEDGEVEGMMMRKLSNHKALSFRKKNNQEKEENLIAKFEENYQIEIEEGGFVVKNKTKIYKAIAIRLKFTSEDLIEEINQKLYITPLMFLAKKKNPFKLKERKFPIDFGTSWEEKNSVYMTIPSGYKIVTTPKSFAIEMPEKLGVFKYIVKVKGNTVGVISLMQIKKPIIGAQFYPFLKEFYKKIVEKQSEKIILEKI